MPSPTPYGRIYLVTNTVNGKVYVGQTTKSMAERWRRHQAAARGVRSSLPLHRAIRKYGPRSFMVVELERCSDANALNQAESRWIQTYESDKVGVGYNCTNGGDVGYRFTLAARSRISRSQKQRLASPAARLALSSAAKVQWRNPSFRQLKTTQAMRQWADPEGRCRLISSKKTYFEVHPDARYTLSIYNKTPAARKAKSASRREYFETHPVARMACHERQLALVRATGVAPNSDLIRDFVTRSEGVLSSDILGGIPNLTPSMIRDVLFRSEKLGLVRSRSLSPDERPDVTGRARSRAKVYIKCS